MSASRPGRFTPGTHWIGGWVDPSTCTDAVGREKSPPLPGIESRPSDPEPSHYEGVSKSFRTESTTK